MAVRQARIRTGACVRQTVALFAPVLAKRNVHLLFNLKLKAKRLGLKLREMIREIESQWAALEKSQEVNRK